MKCEYAINSLQLWNLQSQLALVNQERIREPACAHSPNLELFLLGCYISLRMPLAISRGAYAFPLVPLSLSPLLCNSYRIT